MMIAGRGQQKPNAELSLDGGYSGNCAKRGCNEDASEWEREREWEVWGEGNGICPMPAGIKLFAVLFNLFQRCKVVARNLRCINRELCRG